MFFLDHYTLQSSHLNVLPGVGISNGRKCCDLANESYVWLTDRAYDAKIATLTALRDTHLWILYVGVTLSTLQYVFPRPLSCLHSGTYSSTDQGFRLKTLTLSRFTAHIPVTVGLRVIERLDSLNANQRFEALSSNEYTTARLKQNYLLGYSINIQWSGNVINGVTLDIL